MESSTPDSTSPSRQYFDRNTQGSILGMQVHRTVFGVAAGTILLIVVLAILNADNMTAITDTLQNSLSQYAGWFFVIAVNLFLGVVLYLLFSRYKHIRLGGPDARPEFKTTSWLAMLFAAGMGVGLYFNGVYEPISIYAEPPFGEGGVPGAAETALEFTFLHWGLHPWAVYGLIALAMSFFVYNRGLPMAIRSAFYPVLKERIYGPIGDIIDIVAIVATLFGVATSLGLGAEQVNAGLNYLYGVDQSVAVQMGLIAAITAGATISVVSGLDKGIKILSSVAMYLAIILMILLFVLGPALFIVDTFVQSTGGYLQNFLSMSFYTEAFQGRDSSWQNGWTIAYWAWWISWSPFVGIFIARISRGRTIREFVLGVLLVPTAFSLAWFSVIGGAALYQELNFGGIVGPVQENDATAIFVFLENFPLAAGLSILAIIGVTIFFVTSSDSGSLVIDIISSGGNPEPPVRQRVFWAILEGAVASVLLLGGGLSGLQAAVVATGLPFAMVMVFMTFSLMRGLERERLKLQDSTSSSQAEAEQSKARPRSQPERKQPQPAN